jgi:GxxExxY protein
MCAYQYDPVVEQIIGAAIEVHRILGPGLLESTYEGCLASELSDRRLSVATQVPLPVQFKNRQIDCAYRIDLLVDQDIIVEVKSVDQLAPIHTAQVLTYLRLSGARHALLFNFNELSLKDGLRSYIGRGKYVPHESDTPGSSGP